MNKRILSGYGQLINCTTNCIYE